MDDQNTTLIDLICITHYQIQYENDMIHVIKGIIIKIYMDQNNSTHMGVIYQSNICNGKWLIKIYTPCVGVDTEGIMSL